MGTSHTRRMQAMAPEPWRLCVHCWSGRRTNPIFYLPAGGLVDHSLVVRGPALQICSSLPTKTETLAVERVVRVENATTSTLPKRTMRKYVRPVAEKVGIQRYIREVPDKRDTKKGTKTCPFGSSMVSPKSEQLFWNEWRGRRDSNPHENLD